MKNNLNKVNNLKKEVIPEQNGKRKIKYYDTLSENGIGLIGVSNNSQKKLVKAKRNTKVKQYIRLVNLIQTNIKKASI